MRTALLTLGAAVLAAAVLVAPVSASSSAPTNNTIPTVAGSSPQLRLPARDVSTFAPR